MSAEKTTKQEQPKSDSQIQSKDQKNITDIVLNKVQLMESTGAIKLPENYSAANALKFAFLILQEIEDKDKKPVLQSCTQASIANALLDMVIQGLNPMKKQCYFIAYGNKLQMSRSYMGTIAVAKRYGNLKNIRANVVYGNDKPIKYEIDTKTGRQRLISHEPSMENIDIGNIKGAYAIYELNDGTVDMEIMSIDQIKKAWGQGKVYGNQNIKSEIVHDKFTDQMCIKTVINRACKLLINSSDDSALFSEENNDPNKVDKIPSDANTIETTFEDVTHEQLEAEKETTQANGVKKETVQTEIAINENDKADF